MKLNKKHIGKLFDVNGGDGSWYYQLVDVKKDRLLFCVFSTCLNQKYEIEDRKTSDWRPFQPSVKEGWKTGREAR